MFIGEQFIIVMKAKLLFLFMPSRNVPKLSPLYYGSVQQMGRFKNNWGKKTAGGPNISFFD